MSMTTATIGAEDIRIEETGIGIEGTESIGIGIAGIGIGIAAIAMPGIIMSTGTGVVRDIAG